MRYEAQSALSYSSFSITYWVRRRDEWRRKFRQFMSDGRALTKQQRSTA